MRGETLTGADPLFAPLLTSSPSVWKPSVGRFPSGRAALSPTCWQSTDRDTLSWLTDRWSCHTEQRESSHPLSQTLSTRCYACSCSYSFYIDVFILGSFASCLSLWTRLYQPQWGRPRPRPAPSPTPTGDSGGPLLPPRSPRFPPFAPHTLLPQQSFSLDG